MLRWGARDPSIATISPWNQPQGRPRTKKWGKFKKPSCLSSYSARLHPEAWHCWCRKSLAARLIVGIHSWLLHGGGCICILLPNDMGLQDMDILWCIGLPHEAAWTAGWLEHCQGSDFQTPRLLLIKAAGLKCTVRDEIATMLQITLSFVVVKSQCSLRRLWFCTLGLCLPRLPCKSAWSGATEHVHPRHPALVWCAWIV